MRLVIFQSEDRAEKIGFCIDGRGFEIPANETWEVPEIVCTDHNNNGPYEYRIPEKDVMERILADCWIVGMVEVPVIRTKAPRGTHYDYDAEAALVLAKAKRVRSEEQIVANYVTRQRERIAQNLAAFPPNPVEAKIFAKRGINLEREYNIKPVGFAVANASDRDDRMNQLEKDNQELRDQMKRFLQTQDAGKVKHKE